MNQVFDPQRLDRVRQWADALVADEKLPSAGILIWHAGQEQLAHFCGYQRVEDQTPFARETVARIYSMTKPITSVGIMQFVERGLLTLDTRIDQIIPAFGNMKALVPGATSLSEQVPVRAPTVHELLVHTSGLSYSFNEGLLPKAMATSRLGFGPKAGGLEVQVEKLAELPLAFEPGTQWEYSVGIDVAGRILEVLSGQSLEAYFQEYIFAPLGMHDTSFAVRLDQLSRFSDLYMPSHAQDSFVSGRVAQAGLKRVERAERSHYQDPDTYSGGGGLVGTIDDYMRFVEALRQQGQGENGRMLAPATVAFMLQNHLPGNISDLGPKSFSEEPTTGMGFGLGGAVVTSPARMQVPGNVGDFSWGGMASTCFWLDPTLDLSVVFFTQLTPSSAYAIRPQLKALVHAALA